MILNQFKKETAIDPKHITEADLLKIMTNENFHHFFDSPHKIISLMEELKDEVEDEDIKKELTTIKYQFQLVENENIIMDLFSKNNRETIEEKIKSFISSNDPLFACSSLLCALISLKNIDFSSEKDRLSENFLKISKIFNEISPVEKSFDLRSDIIELVNSLEERFWQEYQIDLSKVNSSWIHSEEAILSDYSELLSEKMKSDESLKDLTPEQLGFIDITKIPD